MTSFERYLDTPVPLAEARQEMATHMAEIFGLTLTMQSAEQLYERNRIQGLRDWGILRVESNRLPPCPL
jgi:hypothetical protein